MTGFYLKEKRHAGGDFRSKEDIRKIHWKKSPLAMFFTFRSNFVPCLQRENCVQMRGGKRKGGMPFFFSFRCNENQLAGRHYLSILVGECIDMKRKNRPSPNPVKPSVLFLRFFSPSISFSRENIPQTELCFHKTRCSWCSSSLRLYVSPSTSTIFHSNVPQTQSLNSFLLYELEQKGDAGQILKREIHMNLTWGLIYSCRHLKVHCWTAQERWVTLAARWKLSLDWRWMLPCSGGLSLRGDKALNRALSRLRCPLIHTAPPKPPSPILAFLPQVMNMSMFVWLRVLCDWALEVMWQHHCRFEIWKSYEHVKNNCLAVLHIKTNNQL